MGTSHIEGYRLKGVLSLCGLSAQFFNLRAFLLFAPNTRSIGHCSYDLQRVLTPRKPYMKPFTTHIKDFKLVEALSHIKAG